MSASILFYDIIQLYIGDVIKCVEKIEKLPMPKA